jgi:hypothetical protein
MNHHQCRLCNWQQSILWQLRDVYPIKCGPVCGALDWVWETGEITSLGVRGLFLLFFALATCLRGLVFTCLLVPSCNTFTLPKHHFYHLFSIWKQSCYNTWSDQQVIKYSSHRGVSFNSQCQKSQHVSFMCKIISCSVLQPVTYFIVVIAATTYVPEVFVRASADASRTTGRPCSNRSVRCSGSERLS